MRIFVTGASGFIGRHVVPLLLKDKHELLILRRKVTHKSKGQIKSKVVIGDLQNLDRFKKAIIRFDPQVCLHLAWEGLPDYSYEQCKRNVDHSLALIQMLVNETACRKIVVSGTNWEYGKAQGLSREGDKVTGEDQVGPMSFFTWAKNAAYKGAFLLCKQRGVDLIWLRIFYAFGPGQMQKSLIPSLYDAFKNGRTPEIKNPHNMQDFIYVGDIAEAFRLAVKKPIQSGFYNISRGEPVSVGEICRIVAKQMGRKPVCKRPEISKTTAAHSIRNWADISKFRRSTNWRPRVSVQQGIKKYIASKETI